MNNEPKKGFIAWFAGNHVAANLLMILIIAGGILSMTTSNMEMFPEISIDMITITVPYLGASPSEVEEGVNMRVEEAIAGVDGIKRIESTAVEGSGTVMAELEVYADTAKVLDDIKAEVDRIITFPEQTEKPIVTEVTTRNHVVTVMIFGDASERTLKNLAQHVYDELTAKGSISQIEISGVRDYEISIEVSEDNLRKYNLTFEQVASVVGRSALDLPGGSVETRGGEILLRTKGQK